ncbi:MAG: PAS domain S-box protein, partial [Syntrophobacterales bacterium]|nr:PAS domain S-box protein [Syntrophobacterales bacterium]
MKKRILIVDDNPNNLYMLECLLKGYQHEVIAAGNGRDALEKALVHPPNLIITDILMPVMDGYELCRRWKEEERLKHIPFVFYTATYTEKKDEEFALSLGADRFLVKPQDPDDFMMAIKEVLAEDYAARQTAAKPLGEDMEFFRQHNEALFKKLEKKMLELEDANRKLREKEETYRLSFENVTDVIYSVDKDLKVLNVSPSVERILGYKPEEFVGRPISDFGHLLVPESYEQAVADMKSILNGQKIPPSIYRFIAKDGTIKYGEVNISPLIRNGKVVGNISIARDITESRQVQEEIQKTEEKYRTIANYTYDWEEWIGPDGQYIYVSPSCERITGYRADEFQQDPKLVINICHQDDKGLLNDHFQEVLNARSEECRMEFRIHTRDHREVWIDHVCQNVYSIAGEYLGRRSSNRDITDRKRSEEALRVAHARRQELEFIVNHSPAVVWLWRATEGWPVEYVSDNLEVYGYTPDDFTSGRIAFASIVHPDDIIRVGEEVTQYTREGRTEFSQEYRMLTKSGEIRWIDDRTWIRRGPDGAVTHYQGISIDITERRRAEEEVRKLNADLERRVRERTAQLEAINRELESFSYSVSHDLRAPLRTIDGFCEILLEDYQTKLDDRGKDYLERVRHASQQMARLIDDLLKLSRVIRSEFRYEMVDLSALVRDVAETYRQNNIQHEVGLVIREGVKVWG